MRLKTPLPYYGGKLKKLKVLLPLVPEHEIYTEPFAGGAALFFAKQPVSCEVLNDMNGELMNFYAVLKKHYDQLKIEIDASLHSRWLFDKARGIYLSPDGQDEILRAWAVWYLCKNSFAAGMRCFGTTLRGDFPKKIRNAKKEICDHIAARLENATLESEDGLAIIQRYDRSTTFHFIDPPYPDTDCAPYQGHFSMDSLRELVRVLRTVKGRFMLTMYPNDILWGAVSYYGWQSRELIRPVNSNTISGKGRHQPELIITNY